MAWIRRVRTASGATAVQVAESVAGRRQIVAHVGSAHTEAELGLLLEAARRLLDDPDQGSVDLGLESVRSRAGLAVRGEQALLPSPSTSATGVGSVPAPRVVATASDLLYQALAGVYDALGFGEAVGDEVFRDLVLARVVEPTSLLDAGRVLGDLGRIPASERTMRRTLARAHRRGYRDRLAAACFAHASRPRREALSPDPPMTFSMSSSRL
jgi:hypothetical protein